MCFFKVSSAYAISNFKSEFFFNNEIFCLQISIDLNRTDSHRILAIGKGSQAQREHEKKGFKAIQVLDIHEIHEVIKVAFQLI